MLESKAPNLGNAIKITVVAEKIKAFCFPHSRYVQGVTGSQLVGNGRFMHHSHISYFDLQQDEIRRCL